MLWYLYKCLQYILIRLTPTSFSLIPPPLLRTIRTGFIILFSYLNTKYIHHILPLSPFPYAFPSPVVSTPRTDLFYLPVLHFFKCILIVQGILPNPSLLTLSQLPCSPIIQQLRVHCVRLSSYIFVCFFFFSCVGDWTQGLRHTKKELTTELHPQLQNCF
jgi:hypothetical protein